MKKLIFPLLFATQTVSATAELIFSPLNPIYRVGECVTLKLQENLQAPSRFDRVDLWVAIQMPNDEGLLYMTPFAFTPFSTTPQLFRKSLESTKRTHNILDFEVLEGLEGNYIFYAAYVEEGRNPMAESFDVLRSNLAQVSTTLSDEIPLIPVIDCVSVLPAPLNIYAVPEDSQIIVRWDDMTEASSYTVYWHASDGSKGSVSVGAPSYVHTGLINGLTYSYEVAAMDTTGNEGILSLTVDAVPKAGEKPPATPMNLSAEPDDSKVILTWQAVSGADSYIVYWQTAESEIENLSVSNNSFTHNGLINGTAYTYWVTAVSVTGLESGNSVALTTTPQTSVSSTTTTTTTPPISSSMYRYIDNGDGTVTDNWSGLIWLKDANCYGTQSFENAQRLVSTLAPIQCGLNDGSNRGDWRLPTLEELEALVDTRYQAPALSNADVTAQWTEGDVFLNVRNDYYWSSTSVYSSSYYIVDFYYGAVATSATSGRFVWPVRDRY